MKNLHKFKKNFSFTFFILVFCIFHFPHFHVLNIIILRTELSIDYFCFHVIIIFIYCNWVVTQWQWLFYMHKKHEIGYY